MIGCLLLWIGYETRHSWWHLRSAHLGHLHIAVKARDVLKLEEVLFVPARRNPMKRRRVQATPLQRFELCQELIAGEPGLAVSDIELTRGGLSYSVDTLEELQRSEPGNYWLILGADAVVTLPIGRTPSGF